MNSQQVERESRMWYLVNDGGFPVKSEGWRCTPGNPDYWWFPTQGWSIPESELYGDMAAAREAAIARATAEVEAAKDRLRRLAAEDFA